MTRSPIQVMALMEASCVTGPARNLIQFAREAREAVPGLPAVELSIATFQRGTPESNDFVRGARDGGVPVDVIAERYRFDRGVIRQLLAIVERRRPDIIQTHNVKSHLLIRLTGLWRRYPWIAYHHGYTATDLKTRFYKHLDRWSLPAAHQTVTVCGAFSLLLQQRGVAASRIHVLHNPARKLPPALAEDCRRTRTALGLPADARVVLCVGRLSREKGHLDLIKAIGEVRRLQPKLFFRTLLVGEGPERGRIQRSIDRFGLTDTVMLAGHQKRVSPYYSVADVVVLPSHTEGSPNALLEAIAAGVPVVATSVGGVPEIVTHERSAVLVSRSDTSAMGRAIERLLLDQEAGRELAAEARRIVTTRQTPEAFRRSLVQLYQDALCRWGRLPQGERLAA